ncbi:MAG: cyclic nucleotide-binding serine/threonine-protein kinase [archaeon]|nr:cyclic nucleotide-binding serine/threonine-protein kinase [archaeon]
MGNAPNCCKSNIDENNHLNIKSSPKNYNPPEDMSVNKNKPDTLKIVAKKPNALMHKNNSTKGTKPSDTSLKNTPEILRSQHENLFMDRERTLSDQQFPSNFSPTVKNASIKVCFNKLSSASILYGVSIKILSKLSQNIQLKYFTNEETIFSKNDSSDDNLYLITEGCCKVLGENDKILRILFEGDCFGEICFMSNIKKRTATVKALSQVECYVLNKSICEEAGLTLNQSFKENIHNLFSIRNNNTKLSDLFFIKFINKTNLSTNFLVHDKKKVYQIKLYSQKEIIKDNSKIIHINNEKNIMLSVQGNFTLKGIKTFNDEINFYLLCEYIPYINLKDYLFLKRDLLKEYEVKFYFANMLSALENLHKNKIIHRDIKPMNFNILSNGYLKLCDYYTSKILDKDKTNTIIGTPYYMSPEIIKGESYGLSSDFWSLGICLYELAYASYPFGRYEDTQKEIFNDILNKDIDFENLSKYQSNCTCKCEKESLNNLLNLLLIKDPLGRCSNFKQIKDHSFFDGFNWSSFYKFELKPPYTQKYPPLEKYLECNVPFKDIITKKDSKYFFEDSLVEEVFIKNNTDNQNNKYSFDW